MTADAAKEEGGGGEYYRTLPQHIAIAYAMSAPFLSKDRNSFVRNREPGCGLSVRQGPVRGASGREGVLGIIIILIIIDP